MSRFLPGWLGLAWVIPVEQEGGGDGEGDGGGGEGKPHKEVDLLVVKIVEACGLGAWEGCLYNTMNLIFLQNQW